MLAVVGRGYLVRLQKHKEKPHYQFIPASLPDTAHKLFHHDGTDRSCPTCGGDGMIEYLEAGPEVWGEDCPSEENHLVTCPNCRGSGLQK